MLFDQIRERLRDKMAGELKIDLKIFTAKFSEEPADKTSLAKD
jgi:hypothetical protein